MHGFDAYGLDMRWFPWLEGDRTFAIVFGTLLAGSCFALAFPILWWYLPRTRKWIFPKRTDPRQTLQLCFGVLCMSMMFTNALCRYIPHGPLGFCHAAFFLTTLALLALMGPRVVAVALGRNPESFAVPAAPLTAALVVLIAFPLSAVVNAFWF